MKQFVLLVLLCVFVCTGYAQTELFNPSQFYRNHEDTEHFWLAVPAFEQTLASLEKNVSVAASLPIKRYICTEPVTVSDLAAHFSDKAFTVTEGLWVIQQCMEGNLSDGSVLHEGLNAFPVEVQGALYAILVYPDVNRKWKMHAVNPADAELVKAFLPTKQLVFLPGATIIAAR